MNRKESIMNLKAYFPKFIGQSLEGLVNYESIHEIRMRSGRPPGIVSFGKEKFLTEKGSLTDYADMCRRVTQEDLEYSFRAVCDYSIHSCRREISEGFITLEGGSRVGICGTAVTESEKVTALKYISGLNFRIAGQALGCGEQICRSFEGNLRSLLIIGPPMSGKTTVIRDICRILGKKHHISVIDERGEIGAVYHGIPGSDVGVLTDILDGYPKAEGIMTAVRVMSPEIVVCDEIGGKDDCEALLSAANTGVCFIASVHGSGIAGLKKRKFLNEIIENGVFESYAVLESGSRIGKIKETGAIKC